MSESDFVFEGHDPIAVGTPIENEFVFERETLVSDGDISDFAFITDRGLGTGLSTLTVTVFGPGVDGPEIGSNSVQTEEPVTIGDRIGWAGLTDVSDIGYMDSLKHIDGTVIEDWSGGPAQVDNYTFFGDTNADFTVQDSVFTSAPYGLEIDAAASTAVLFSDFDAGMHVGETYRVDLRQDDTGSTTFPLRNGIRAFRTPDREGGIRVRLNNNFGARFDFLGIVNDTIDFPISLGEWYRIEFAVTIA